VFNHSLMGAKMQTRESACGLPCRTLVIGAAGSLLLDWYGWESVFYFSGLLTLLWVYCTCKYLLVEKGKISPPASGGSFQQTCIAKGVLHSAFSLGLFVLYAVSA